MSEAKVWTEEEDLILRKLKDDQRINKWTAIAQVMAEQYNIKGRNGKQCKERYQFLCEDGNEESQWNYEQQQKLFLLHSQLGNKWAIIGQQINNRTDNDVKNHLYSKLRKALRKINKIIKERFKKEFKEIKQNLIYKIIEGAEDKFKNSPLLEAEVSEYCTELKMKLLNFSYEEQQINKMAVFEDNELEVRSLIEEMIEFTRDYKRKPKKVRRASGQDFEVSAIDSSKFNLLKLPVLEYDNRVRSTGNSPCNSEVSDDDSEDMSEFNSFSLKVPKGILNSAHKGSHEMSVDHKSSNESREKRNSNIIIKPPSDMNYFYEMQEEKDEAVNVNAGFGGFGNFAPETKDSNYGGWGSNNHASHSKNPESMWGTEKPLEHIWMTSHKHSSSSSPMMVDENDCVENELNKVGILEESEQLYAPPHPSKMKKLNSSKRSNFSNFEIEEEQQHIMFNDDSCCYPRIQMTAVEGKKFLMMDSSVGRSDKLFESKEDNDRDKEKAFGMIDSVDSRISDKLFNSKE